MAWHKLYTKMSKCKFSCREVEYLDHIIYREWLKIDPKNIKAIVRWPIPNKIKSLRRFLGSIGYYTRFIKRYE
jgi:hypothetical protein